MKSAKKKNRLLLLRKEIKKETPLEINKQDIERNVSKSWFDRSTRHVSSIKNYSYQKINLTKDYKYNYRYNLSSNPKTSRPLRLKYKILFDREKEKPVQLKYLNNEILDELFSKQINNSDIVHRSPLLQKKNINIKKKTSSNCTKISNISTNIF